ncbi:MAG TPA: aspartate aminotransferase family protein [Thermomicrobiales bacterium]|nr:aspartate aminotransferase family protein [Thermomicrobiales bacterium]
MGVTISAADVARRDERAVANALKIRYTPFVMDRAEAGRLFDLDGRSYLDFGAAWSLAGLGYSNERVRSAVMAELERTTFGGLVSGINLPAVDLAERLIHLVPGHWEKKVWYGLSGSDASEAAMRLLPLATGRSRFVSFVGSWHGTHDGTMGLSAHPSLTGVIGGANVIKAPYPDPYHPPFLGGTDNLTDQCLHYLERYLFRTICEPRDVAAIFVEAVQSDGGDVVPPPDFMPKLRALCDRHGILLAVDEIKVGLARTGRMFAFEHGGIEADVVLLGKSLGGGMPLSAVVARREVLDAATGAALFTASGNAAGCAAGLAVLDEIDRLDLVQHAAELGGYLHECLVQALGDVEIVGDIRGLGMIQGVELVKDRASREPDQSAAAKVVYRAWELGLIVYYAGNWGNVLEITPPLILSRPEIEEGVEILRQAVRDVLAGKVSDEAVASFAGW